MLETLRAAWERLTIRQRIALSAVTGLCLVALVAVGVWSSRPAYSVLYSGLSAEDASAVVEELRAQKTPYRLAAGGGRIEVPTTALYETRLTLASKGLPSHSSVGFELFDRSSLPGTDFSNTVNLQRALQGELARTICALSEVRSARVHLSMPRENLYEEPTPPSASVLLDLGPTGSLKPEQVRGIVYLVASAVQNLRPADVTVVDSNGNVLSGAGSGLDLSDTVFSTSKAYSEALTNRLQTMLDAMFGVHRTIVRAQAELNLDAEESSEERMEPAGANQSPAISKEHATRETYNGGASSVGGASGVPARVLGGGTTTGVSNGTYQSTEETREYEFSKKTTTRRGRPGRITRLTVAAVVDESLAQVGVDKVREVLQAAAGIDPARGDSIVVRPMKLKSAEEADKEEKELAVAQVAQERQALLERMMRWGLPFTIVLILAGVLVRTVSELRHALVPAEAEYTEQLSEQQPDSAEAQAHEEMAAHLAAAADIPTTAEDAVSEQARQAVEELQRLAREQPDLLAEQLRSLVSGPETI
jgi:flagellar M-ring protein FliF